MMKILRQYRTILMVKLHRQKFRQTNQICEGNSRSIGKEICAVWRNLCMQVCRHGFCGVALKIVTCVVMAVAVLALSSCGIINKVDNAVVYPETYSITYEITTPEGLIHTMTKTVDESGNVYFKTTGEEQLFLNDNGSYTLYEKNADGVFSAVEGAKYTREAVENQVALFDQYAKQTTNKFIPTARRTGETTVAGRTADTYRLGVNLLAASFFHLYTVDQETGVCLEVSVQNKALGKEREANEETFVCIEFVTENVEDLASKISK